VKVCADSIVFSLQPVGGISTYWMQLCEALATREDITLMARLGRQVRNDAGAALLDGIADVERDALPTRVARYLPVLTPKDALLHSSYYRVPASGARVPLVVTVYDFIYERFTSGLARAVHSAQKSMAIRCADVVLCISHSTRSDLLERHPGIDPGRVLVTHLSYDRSIFHPITKAERKTDLLDAVVFVGARTGYKRFDLAVAAVRPHSATSLAIVGPPLGASERSLLDDRLPGRWRYMGRLSNEQLRVAYGSCCALIYPSDYEGFGLPLLEAMACGAPVVTNRNSSLGEVGGQAPIYSVAQTGEAYADALGAIFKEDARAAAVIRGLARCDDFSWSRMADETVAAYRLLAPDEA
jgi:mannosyltransferase